MPQRQEVINVILAQLLAERGLVAAPEQILRGPSRESQMPDVLIDFQGLRLAIEAEFRSTQDAARRAINKARERVENSIAHLGVAIVYPASLRPMSFARTARALADARLQYSIITELTSPETQLHLFGEPDYRPQMLTGSIDDLSESLRRSYDELVRDDILQRASDFIQIGIASVQSALEAQPATTGRLAREIGVWNISESQGQSSFTAKESAAINRISSLILVNALIFQEVLSQHDQRVHPLARFRDSSDILSYLRDHWHYILNGINYHPIFYTAIQILGCLSADSQLERALKELIRVALRIVACRAALRHDLAGRIYHRLLEEAKYLGAYYTSVPAAVLLLKLALRKDRYPLNWASLEELQTLHIADLACGTGTLLMAAVDTIIDNYVRDCMACGRRPDLTTLHQILVSNTIYGYDVLASAVHLTASTLSLRVPETPINLTHLYKMQLGGESRSLGSLEFLDSSSIQATLFSAPEQVTGPGIVEAALASIPRLDLCVMNPPFTRSVGCNLLFGNFPETERHGMQRRLRRIVSSRRIDANITAGLGSPFVALANEYIKPQGSMALVLPRSLLSGVAWERTRRLIERDYYVEYILVSHQPGHWNFSENTALSECLIVARRLHETGADGGEHLTTYVNIWQQPRTSTEALSVASAIINENGLPRIDNHRAFQDLIIGGRKIGEVSTVLWDYVKGNWLVTSSFAQGDLNKALYHLQRAELFLPRLGVCANLPFVPLERLGELGFDRRDIHDGFTLARSRTAYPAVWGQSATQNTTLLQMPNSWLQARRRGAEGRHLRDADRLWQKAGRILIAERFRLNTMRVPCAWVEQKVLANVCWTFVLNTPLESIAAEKALVLWLNSTLGLIILFGSRVETEGPWIDFKKPLLEKMPALDITHLTEQQLSQVTDLFDSVSNLSLGQLESMSGDRVRIAIDEAFSRILGIPDLTPLRELLTFEPSICMSLDRIMPSTH
ncbi:MAG: hypothetical protein A2169_11075 [Deltaproteobacteria bacterium RBG_13_47_9]|nr:MAG: hypothetical protein A2169_11075 [Deltaproteobacteria bacterium RBG_13_47_9]